MKRGFPHFTVLAAMLAASVALSACGGGSDDDKRGNSPVADISPAAPTTTPAVPGSAPSAAAPASTASGSTQPATPAQPPTTPIAPTTPDVPTPPTTPPTPPTTPDSGQPPKDNTNDTPPPSPVATNSVPIVVDNAIGSVVNMPYVSVTLCAPGARGATQCATVDHMLLDTGSSGVRVTQAALGAALAAQLPAQTGASNDTTGNAPIAQCAVFASGYTWGSIRRADVMIGGETASGIPIQLIGDSAYPSAPSDCLARGGASMNTAAMLGANGIVGIGHLARDFPQAAQTALAAAYYYCVTPSSCMPARVPLDRQTANPVAAFATDNNGTIVRLPALPPTGQASVTGELVFGIGTRDNNALPATPTFLAATDRGAFTTTYKGRTITSVVDSGSNGLFFPDATLPVLLGWFAPAITQSLSGTMLSNTGNAQSTVPFSIANAPNLFDSALAAYDALGAPASGMFIWGLPFFFGRSVYTALSGMQAGMRTGPYVAF
ncbi:DUF3443 family protein [Paraburkholderia diazotrophica]|uniref:DUF3443 family protein n=1 Tax=Paraburkholderia diazotrophica TaxID=667676 RepID=UPI00316F0A57